MGQTLVRVSRSSPEKLSTTRCVPHGCGAGNRQTAKGTGSWGGGAIAQYRRKDRQLILFHNFPLAVMSL